MSEEGKELTEAQKRAKEILDEVIAERLSKLQGDLSRLQGELDALGNMDTEKLARKIGEEKEETPP